MLGELMRIGDVVTVDIGQEAREWGYNPYPDGTKVTIEGWGEIHYGHRHNYGYGPGVFENRCWVDVVDKKGKRVNISSCYLKGDPPKGRERQDHIRLRDLPETAFWEEDVVVEPEICRMWNVKELHVVGIDYAMLTHKRDDGSPMPIYRLSDDETGGMSTSSRDETKIKLVRRGNVWRYFHGEKPKFADLKAEAKFFDSLGHTTEIRNPKNELYSWTKDEVLEAIQNGLGHSMSVDRGFFGMSDTLHHRVIKFNDPELGARVAEATLEGFGLSKK